MQSCKKCKITIAGDKACCPLCGGTLAGEPEKGAYPVIPYPSVSRMSFMRVSTFIFLAFEAAMLVLIFGLSESPDWIPAAMIGALIAVGDIALIVYYRNNPMLLIVAEIYIGLIISFVVNLIMGRPYWVFEWLMPFVFVGMTIVIAVIGKLTHRLVEEYILYLLFDVIMSTVMQLIPILAGANTIRVVALSSIAFVIVFFLGMVIFNGKTFFNEASKFFNI